MPENGGLGAHLTLDLANQAKFGPDVEWVDSIDYTVDPKRADRFYSMIRHYWPGLPDGSLQPSYSGTPMSSQLFAHPWSTHRARGCIRLSVAECSLGQPLEEVCS